jgi:hypothetical protein
MSHVEPNLLRWYAGRADRLIDSSVSILAGQEVPVPCMVGDNANDLQLRRARIWRLKASLKIQNYDPKSQFVAWGSGEFVSVAGMPGFSRHSPLPCVGPDAQAISCVDLDGDSSLDLCLAGTGKFAAKLLKDGAYSGEVLLPNLSGGCRAAVWGDYNGDGKPDLLLATLAGPKLYTNLGNGTFRDDSALLPKEQFYNLTAAAWIDYDGDGKPDILLGNGFHGLRLYRNRGKAEGGLWFEDVSKKEGLGPNGIGSDVKGDTLTVCDVNGDGRPDFLYGAGTGLLVLNTPKGFVVARESGISYVTGGVGPVFGDFNNDGHPDLFVPRLDGRCKLFQNDGKGRFTDVTEKAGDLSRSLGLAACAAWGDFDNDGRLDLVIGCLRGPNRFFRNRGDGTFEDATEAIGLHKRIFNTRAIALADLNGDGALDMVLSNEGQESCVLLGNPGWSKGRPVVLIQVAGGSGVVGSRVRVLDEQGKFVAAGDVGLSDGRGGQRAPMAHFALKPGTYRAEVRYSNGVVRTQKFVVLRDAVRVTVDEKTPLGEAWTRR